MSFDLSDQLRASVGLARTRHATVAPVFQDILGGICPPPQIPLSELADYVQALKDMDWQFEYSDDHSVWGNGRNALARLRLIQKRIDPDAALWNLYAHRDYQVSQLLGETR